MKKLLALVLLLAAGRADAALIERLIGTEEPKLAVHQFMAALGEWERGKITRAQVISGFGIGAPEEAELDAIFAKFVPPPDSISMGGIVTLTNVGAAYDTIAAAKGLGFVRLEGSGLSELEFVVRYNKIGTGTLDWQLWDDTLGVQVGIISDAAAAGDNKQGVVTITPAQPLAAGLHTIRVRARSSVAADDPVFYGASIRVKRVNVMWSEILHEILLLAEYRTPPYDTATAVRTRLGLP